MNVQPQKCRTHSRISGEMAQYHPSVAESSFDPCDRSEFCVGRFGVLHPRQVDRLVCQKHSATQQLTQRHPSPHQNAHPFDPQCKQGNGAVRQRPVEFAKALMSAERLDSRVCRVTVYLVFVWEFH